MTLQEWIQGKPLYQPILCPIELLISADYNPRQITNEKLKALQESIKGDPDFLRLRPILINTRQGREGIIYAGNQRLLATRGLGHTEVYVMLDNIDEATEKARNIKDNVHQGEWVMETLQLNLQGLHGMGYNMESIGYTPQETVDYLGGKALLATDPKNDPNNKGAPRKPKLKIAEGAELECPNCHSTFTYGIKANMTGDQEGGTL